VDKEVEEEKEVKKEKKEVVVEENTYLVQCRALTTILGDIISVA